MTELTQLPIHCLYLTSRVPEESRIDDAGNYAEFPYWKEGVLPFMATRASSIDRLLLASGPSMRLDKSRLVKVVNEVALHEETAELTHFDLQDEKLTDFLFLYFDHPGWLSGFIQSSDAGLLRDFLSLFPPVFRENCVLTRDAAGLLPNVFRRGLLGAFKQKRTEDVNLDEHREWKTLVDILSHISGSTFLISSLGEGTMWCIFAEECVFAALREDGVIA